MAVTLRLWLAVAVAACVVAGGGVAVASRGDREKPYRRCVVGCLRGQCSGDATAPPPDFWLQLFRWTCLDNCKYECSHIMTDSKLEQGLPIEQYHGKWPFTRVLGVQELFSCVFSIANGVPFVQNIRTWRESHARLPLRPLLMIYPWIGICCWFWSAAFHARDVLITERLDYHCATLLVGFLTYGGIVRAMQPTGWRHRLLVFVMLAAFVSHVAYLDLVHFDYGWNFAVTGGALVVGAVAWIVHTFRQPRPYSWKCRTVMVLTMLFGLLDVFDFPPVANRLLDAHAIWHASTVPLGFVWCVVISIVVFVVCCFVLSRNADA